MERKTHHPRLHASLKFRPDLVAARKRNGVLWESKLQTCGGNFPRRFAKAGDSAGLYYVQVTYRAVLKQAHHQEVVRVQIHAAIEFSLDSGGISDADVPDRNPRFCGPRNMSCLSRLQRRGKTIVTPTLFRAVSGHIQSCNGRPGVVGEVEILMAAGTSRR